MDTGTPTEKTTAPRSGFPKLLNRGLLVSGGCSVLFFLVGMVALVAFAGILLVKVSADRHERQERAACERVLHLLDEQGDGVLKTLRGQTGELAQIRDEQLRHEMSWRLAVEWIQRGHFEQIKEQVMHLIPPLPAENTTTAYRQLRIARSLVSGGEFRNAWTYYNAAKPVFLHEGKPDAYLTVLREQTALLAVGCATSRAEFNESLSRLESQLAAIGGNAEPEEELALLRALAKVRRGKDAGCSTEAKKELVEIVSRHAESDTGTLSPFLLVYLGGAHLALGEEGDAVDLLREGISRLGGESFSARCVRVFALEQLARVALKLERAQAALALLERASAEARGVLPATSLIMSRITGDRAWALYISQRFEYALPLFEQQLRMLPDEMPELRMDPLEGCGRCCLSLGETERAAEFIRECAELYEKLAPGEHVRLGSLYLLLGQCREKADQLAESADTYKRAAELLPTDHPLRHDALVGQASALMQAQDWAAACSVWEQLLPLVPELDRMQREEIANQLEYCQSMLKQAPQRNNR